MGYSIFLVGIFALGVSAIPADYANAIAQPDPEKLCQYGLEIGPDMTGIIPPTKLSGNKADFVSSNPTLHPQRLAKYPEARIHAQTCIHNCHGGDDDNFPTGDYWLTLGLPYGSPSIEDKAKSAGKWSIWTAGKLAANAPYELPTEAGANITLYATCAGCPGTGGVFGTKATWTNVLNGTVTSSSAECCTKKCEKCEATTCEAHLSNPVTCLLTTCCQFSAAVGCKCQKSADACGPSGH